jgi:methyl-accepting chemotaxis protein
LILLFLSGLIFFGIFALNRLNLVKINGDLYRQIIQGKDIIADILPPPEYILESHLNVFQLKNAVETNADSAVIQSLIEKSKQLRKDYEDRHKYWTDNLPDGVLKEELTQKSYDPAEKYFTIRDNEFIPAVLAGDKQRIQDILQNSLEPEYEKHRAEIDLVVTEANDLNQEYEKNAGNLVSSASVLLGLIGFAIALICSIIAALIVTSITSPIKKITSIANTLAMGNIDQDIPIHSKDEIGALANSFREMIAYQTSMAEAAEQLSNGNLLIDIHPKSKEDVLGNAFSRMIKNLRDTIGGVTLNAGDLNKASTQLAHSSDQAGQATSQIANVIQQISLGITQQTEAATHSATSMEQLRRAIENVSRGAQAQAEAISKMSTLTSSLSISIEQVAGNTNAVSIESKNAADAAREGSISVSDTIEGMENIRTKVGFSSKKVQEMGSRSDQIGAIIETIDDIASQTNLLALNAAIEAARAGEYGKGFAVVADEVRKLAERSSAATREIGSLIRSIQETVAEAVIAMDESASEVEIGSERASKSGIALENILKAAEAVNGQAQLAASAVSQMGQLSNDLVTAADDVSAIVEENTAATEQMSAGSSEISEAIINISSVSEENAAAIQEVTASAEEMSAQVEEVNASAQTLSEMAEGLQNLVNRFKSN